MNALVLILATLSFSDFVPYAAPDQYYLARRAVVPDTAVTDMSDPLIYVDYFAIQLRYESNAERFIVNVGRMALGHTITLQGLPDKDGFEGSIGESVFTFYPTKRLLEIVKEGVTTKYLLETIREK